MGFSEALSMDRLILTLGEREYAYEAMRRAVPDLDGPAEERRTLTLGRRGAVAQFARFESLVRCGVTRLSG